MTKMLIALLLIHVAMLGWEAFVNSPTIDEVEWLPGGLAQWKTGRGDLVIRNPPHVGLLAAVPLLFANFDAAALNSNQDARSIGRELIRTNGVRSFWLFTSAITRITATTAPRVAQVRGERRRSSLPRHQTTTFWRLLRHGTFSTMLARQRSKNVVEEIIGLQSRTRSQLNQQSSGGYLRFTLIGLNVMAVVVLAVIMSVRVARRMAA